MLCREGIGILCVKNEIKNQSQPKLSACYDAVSANGSLAGEACPSPLLRYSYITM